MRPATGVMRGMSRGGSLAGRLARAGILLGALVAHGCGVFGGDEVQDPPAELVDFKPTLKVRKAWDVGIGDGTEFLRLALRPATDGALVFAAAHDGRVGAWDLERGRRQWLSKTKKALSAGPSVAEGLVVLGSNNGEVLALRADSGELAWSTTVSSEVLAEPLLTERLVFVRTVDGKLVALNREDGAEAWFVQQSVPRLSLRGTGSPALFRNRVVCGFDNGRVAAYETSDGTLAWELLLTPPSGRNEVERLTDLNTTLRVVGADAYVAGFQGQVTSLALESGQVLWARDVSSHAEIGVDLANLYVTSEKGEVMAFTRQAGRELWRHDQLLNRDVTGPTPFGSSVVVGDFEGYLHWYDAASGALQARVRAGKDRITGAPVAVGELLLVLTDGGRLFAYRLAEP